MKRHALPLLVALNALLLCGLLLLWVSFDGTLRGIVWSPPAPRLTDLASQVPTIPSPTPADTSTFLALLEKPLFSPSRRPPPAAPQGAPAAPVDNFSTAQLTGIFKSAGVSGIIMRMAGKDMRVQLNQSIDGWALQSVAERSATFASGAQTRELQLKRADVSQAAPGVPASGAATGAGSQPLPFAPAPLGVPNPANRPDRANAPLSANQPPAGASPAPGQGDAAAPSGPRAVFGGTRH